MDSYEIVKRAIRFEGPERIPFNFGGIGYSDFAGVDYNSSMTKVSEIEEIDEWGCTWEKILEDKTMGQCVGHPLEDWDNLKEYKWPDPDAPERFKDKDLKGQLSHADEKFVLAHIEKV